VVSAGKVAKVTWANHLSDPFSAYGLMLMVLGKDARLVNGGLPARPEDEAS